MRRGDDTETKRSLPESPGMAAGWSMAVSARTADTDRGSGAVPGPPERDPESGVLISWLTRVGIALGVVFLMTVKPGAVAAVLAVLIAGAAGAALGIALWKVRRTPGTDGQHEREGQVA